MGRERRTLEGLTEGGGDGVNTGEDGDVVGEARGDLSCLGEVSGDSLRARTQMVLDVNSSRDCRSLKGWKAQLR